MYTLSSTPVTTKAKKVLVITHPRDSHSPAIGHALSQITYETKQIIRVGEHILTESRLMSFDTVIIPSVEDTLWSDMLLRVKQHYAQLLNNYAHDSTKHLIVYGNALLFLPKKVLKIPHSIPLRREKIIRDTDGLDILPFNCDIDFDPKHSSKEYIHELCRYSNQYTIYLFDASLIYHSQLGIRHGNVYQVFPTSIKQIRELVHAKNEKEQQVMNERKIPPMRYIYEETPSEKKESQIGKTQHTDSKVVAR